MIRYILTHHNTLLAVDAKDGSLKHVNTLSVSADNAIIIETTLVDISHLEAQPEEGELGNLITGGPLAGYVYVKNDKNVTEEGTFHLLRDGFFACADPNTDAVVCNREVAATWESFRFIPNESAVKIETFLNQADCENLWGVHPFQWTNFEDSCQGSLDAAVRRAFQKRETSVSFTVSLSNGPMDRVIVKFLENNIEYVVPGEFYNAERRNTFTNRWLCTRPLFARVKELYPSLRGACQLWLDDEPSGPGLAFCGNGTSHVCIPDAIFLMEVGYASRRADYARKMRPWAARSAKIFWRGGTSGFPRNPWQAIPRIDLCLKVKEIDQDSMFDIGISHIAQIYDEQEKQEIIDSGILRGRCPQIEFMEYKFTIDIDGNTCSWPGLLLKLLMQNTVIKVGSLKGFRQWYYERLRSWDNFIPLSSSMTEIYEVAQWLREHDSEAEQIAIRGRELAESLTFDRAIMDVAPVIRDHVEATKMIYPRCSKRQ